MNPVRTNLVRTNLYAAPVVSQGVVRGRGDLGPRFGIIVARV